MRKALVIGVDYYAQLSKLFGCVNDANEVKAVLEKHGDGSVNFGVFLRLLRRICGSLPSNLRGSDALVF